MGSNTVEENRHVWDREYDWPEDGDEWKGQAQLCGVPYLRWKQSLVEALLLPHARNAVVLEIGCGHGRWTEYIVQAARHTILVDLSPNCLAYCRSRFPQARLGLHCSKGCDLPAELTDCVDFIWSYDVYVHIGPRETAAYLDEIARVLRPGGRAVIHHPGRRHATLWLSGLRCLGPRGTRLYRRISMGNGDDHDGWRANISGKLFARLARNAGLMVEDQLVWWGKGLGVPRFSDRISVLSKPEI